MTPAIMFAFIVMLKTNLLVRCIHVPPGTSVWNHYTPCTKLFLMAKNIYVHVGCDRLVNPDPLDFYARHLMDVWLGYDNRKKCETKVQMSSRLASLGYTMSLYTTRIDKEIDDAMRSAKRSKRRLTCLKSFSVLSFDSGSFVMA